MIIYSHEANPCFNKTNCSGMFQWQPMITHDPMTEWVKITENWWKSGARGQMALKRRICDYYFLSLLSDRAWIYSFEKIYRAIDTICQCENAAFVSCQWQMINSSHGCRNQPLREDAFPRRWLIWFTMFPSVKCILRYARAVVTSVPPTLLLK